MPPGLNDVVDIACGDQHVLALRRDGSVVGWGSNTYGENEPPGTLQDVVVMGVGVDHDIFVTSDGKYHGCGNNFYGELNAPFEVIPQQMQGGMDHTIALYDGRWIAWGSNLKKQLEPTIPEAGFRRGVAIAAGYDHCLFLEEDGIVRAWGANDYGQATPPEDLRDVQTISAGNTHSLALLRNGTVRAWGVIAALSNETPPWLRNVKAIASGTFHCLALRTDGTVVAWGYNSDGQTNVPAGLKNVVAIAAGYDFSMALKSDGTVAAWGSNAFGIISYSKTLSNVVAIAAKDFRSHAVVRSNRILKIENSRDDLRIQIHTFASKNYQLQTTGDLTHGPWINVNPSVIQGTGETLFIPHLGVANDTKPRFYRVITL